MFLKLLFCKKSVKHLDRKAKPLRKIGEPLCIGLETVMNRKEVRLYWIMIKKQCW